jgi:hypothetical protein
MRDERVCLEADASGQAAYFFLERTVDRDATGARQTRLGGSEDLLKPGVVPRSKDEYIVISSLPLFAVPMLLGAHPEHPWVSPERPSQSVAKNRREFDVATTSSAIRYAWN